MSDGGAEVGIHGGVGGALSGDDNVLGESGIRLLKTKGFSIMVFTKQSKWFTRLWKLG